MNIAGHDGYLGMDVLHKPETGLAIKHGRIPCAPSLGCY